MSKADQQLNHQEPRSKLVRRSFRYTRRVRLKRAISAAVLAFILLMIAAAIGIAAGLLARG